tara:strand:- start:33 stop:185 length:153 start_codon:yes stop_codon:yes gene_type:complete
VADQQHPRVLLAQRVLLRPARHAERHRLRRLVLLEILLVAVGVDHVEERA